MQWSGLTWPLISKKLQIAFVLVSYFMTGKKYFRQPFVSEEYK